MDERQEQPPVGFRIVPWFCFFLGGLLLVGAFSEKKGALAFGDAYPGISAIGAGVVSVWLLKYLTRVPDGPGVDAGSPPHALFNLFNAASWAQAAPRIRALPGGQSLCAEVAKGAAPWPTIAGAMHYCTSFPAVEFSQLLASGHFDVRWPLTFALYYWSCSGASVDRACADFLTAAGLWDQALQVLPEYGDSEFSSSWRSRFEKARAPSSAS